MIDTRIPVTYLGGLNGFNIPNYKFGVIRLEKLSSLIRENGWEIVVKDTDGLDYTMETLIRMAYKDFLPYAKDNLVYALAATIQKDILYLIIENGGIENYMSRLARGCVNEG